ncbi:hypothetical protein GCM10023403_61480 [Pseudonocardia benzenivorans]
MAGTGPRRTGPSGNELAVDVLRISVADGAASAVGRRLIYHNIPRYRLMVVAELRKAYLSARTG